jgi:HSP20 family protein
MSHKSLYQKKINNEYKFMAFELTPQSFWRFPERLWSQTEEALDLGSGWTLSEDDRNVYVDAVVPGIDPDDVEVSYDENTVWVQGERSDIEEDKERKYYRKSRTSFSYRIPLPTAVSEEREPEVIDITDDVQ